MRSKASMVCEDVAARAADEMCSAAPSCCFGKKTTTFTERAVDGGSSFSIEGLAPVEA